MKKLFAVLLAVLIVSAFVLPVFAADSPGADGKWAVDIYYHLDTVEHDPTVLVDDPGTYTFVPADKEGYEFDYYEVYKVHDGDVKELVETYTTPEGVTINFSSEFGKVPELDFCSDAEIHVYFKEKTPVEPDPTPVSPPTGSNVLPYVALILIGIIGVAVATRKLVKNH